VQTAEGGLAVFAVNSGLAESELSLSLGGQGGLPEQLVVVRTDRDHAAETDGRVLLQQGGGQLSLPGRSVTTLISAGPAQAADQGL
jgi:hypothetical protein